MFKVYFNGELNGWCEKDVKERLENGDFASFYSFEEIFTEPKFLDKYI